MQGLVTAEVFKYRTRAGVYSTGACFREQKRQLAMSNLEEDDIDAKLALAVVKWKEANVWVSGCVGVCVGVCDGYGALMCG